MKPVFVLSQLLQYFTVSRSVIGLVDIQRGVDKYSDVAAARFASETADVAVTNQLKINK